MNFIQYAFSSQRCPQACLKKKFLTLYTQRCTIKLLQAIMKERDDVKKRDLEKKLKALGWWFDKHGGDHDHWTNGKEFEPVPRHTEINENLAKKILKRARNNPSQE